MSGKLSEVDLLLVSTVLEDCADQLAVLENIAPDSRRSGQPAELGPEHHLQTGSEGQTDGADRTEAMKELHRSLQELCLIEGMSSDLENLAKVQKDRHFVEQVIKEVLAEILEKGTVHSLLHAVEQEKKMKADLQDIIIREEEGRLKTKALKKQLVEIRKEKALVFKELDKKTAHLKDQLQEMKVKTSLEKKYSKNCTELLVNQGQKLNTQKEKDLEDEIRVKLEEETRVHTEMKSFLKNLQTSLGEKLEYWMERYEKDIEGKQQELNTLKINKANNLAQLQDLAKKYKESEQVIIEDRLEKENLRQQMDREKLERDSATKIQSWWRGTAVRKGLGFYKKSKKPKVKQGKKGKGKKK